MTTPSSPAHSDVDPEPSMRVSEFMATEGFAPDDFQLESFEAIDEGRNVLVSAPTGSGKTLVGEYAAYAALTSGGRCFYTTPIKALSNQKYRQFRQRFGNDQVGLLTGDHSLNPDAPVVVMTTEVLRNMVYAESPALADLHCVVMDEIHYLGDRSRGVVWEEILLTMDARVQLVGLSATLSNAGELGDWITQVRGETDIVQSDKRPVPLAHMLYTHGDLVPIRAAISSRERRRDQRGEGTGRRPQWARRTDVVERLDDEDLLPAIYFVFSRAGCDGAVSQMRRARLRLTTREEARRIGHHIDAAVDAVPDADLDALEFAEFRASLTAGLAAHHAGMLPLFRVIVEELFSQGLIKVVFATETLALGIHMPARAVVLEKTTKFNGDAHVMLTASEYSQITGRAGRRGIDTKGTAITLDSPDLDLEALSALVDTPRFPLLSAFTPDYSMAVNLVERIGVQAATTLIGQSFAQFQTDRTVVSREHEIAARERERERLWADLEAAGGGEEIVGYLEIRNRLTALERRTEAASKTARGQAVRKAMATQQPGAVVTVGRKRFGLVATVLQTRTDIPDDPALLCLTDSGWIGWLRHHDFAAPPVLLTRVEVPSGRRKLSGAAKRHILARMERLRGKAKSRIKNSETKPLRKDPRIAKTRRELKAHPLHGDPQVDALARRYERWARVDADVRHLRGELEGDADSLARRFRRITDLLTEIGYLEPAGSAAHVAAGSTAEDATSAADGASASPAGGEGLAATDAGILLAGVHSEQDLLIAECLRRGAWSGLDAAGLTAAVASIVAHPRSETVVREPSDETLREALAATTTLAEELARHESDHGLEPTPDLDFGLAPALHHWVSGGSLASVLAASWQEGIDLTAGDFVRSARLVLDVLAQIAKVSEDSDPQLAASARSAVGHVRRGVVIDSSA